MLNYKVDIIDWYVSVMEDGEVTTDIIERYTKDKDLFKREEAKYLKRLKTRRGCCRTQVPGRRQCCRMCRRQWKTR